MSQQKKEALLLAILVITAGIVPWFEMTRPIFWINLLLLLAFCYDHYTACYHQPEPAVTTKPKSGSKIN